MTGLKLILLELGLIHQSRVVEEAQHPGLKVSFDNGHALIFSEVPASGWIRAFGSDLAHCHLHDNDGEYDSHRPIGEGTENWRDLMSELQQLEEEPVVVLESDQLGRNKVSLTALLRILDGGAA